jgi:hypothetical protein
VAHFEVLMVWTDSQGEHKPGDVVELPTETPAEKVEADKLVRYGIIQEKSADADTSSTIEK